MDGIEETPIEPIKPLLYPRPLEPEPLVEPLAEPEPLEKETIFPSQVIKKGASALLGLPLARPTMAEVKAEAEAKKEPLIGVYGMKEPPLFEQRFEVFHPEEYAPTEVRPAGKPPLYIWGEERFYSEEGFEKFLEDRLHFEYYKEQVPSYHGPPEEIPFEVQQQITWADRQKEKFKEYARYESKSPIGVKIPDEPSPPSLYYFGNKIYTEGEFDIVARDYLQKHDYRLKKYSILFNFKANTL